MAGVADREGGGALSDGESLWQHRESGGEHLCLFCNSTYWCAMKHCTWGEALRYGGRCCPECKSANLLALDKWETARRRKLYV